MSASTEKKLRAQAREEGTDKRSVKAAEEAKKQAKRKKNTWLAVIGVILFIAIVLFLNSNIMFKNTTALTVGDDKFSPAEVGYSYGTSYQNFVNTYGDYASMFGLNTSYGISGLSSQPCTMGEEGQSWKDFFVEQAEGAIRQYVAMANYAKEQGIELSEEDVSEIDANYEALEQTATAYGYGNGDKFLAANFGRGVDISVAKAMDKLNALAFKGYQSYKDGLEIADADIESEYPSVNVRHILVKAVADENGEVSEAAIAEAKAKAEEILAEYKDGDKTAEAFGALAEKYSEDPGSNTNGGLYENVLQGQMIASFNDWCFDASRKTGDTGIVEGSGSSENGFHVMYFAGKVAPADNTAGRNKVINEKMEAWVADLTEATPEPVENFWIRLVGKF